MEVQSRKLILTEIICGICVFQDGKFLVVQEKLPKAYGQWNWPAGKAEEGSTLIENAQREGEEETGYKIKILDKIDIFEKEFKPLHLYSAEIIGGQARPQPEEILQLGWYSLEDLEKLPLRHPWVLEGARKFLERRVR